MISLIKITAENLGRFEEGILEIETASFPSPWTADAFREEARRSFSHLWVLVENSDVVGYVCFWVMAGEVHLMNIAVHPENRCKGLGRYLLHRMIAAGIRGGARCALLEVRPSNVSARTLYKKSGFREVGRRPKYYRDTGEDAILMVLDFGPREISDLEREGDVFTSPFMKF